MKRIGVIALVALAAVGAGCRGKQDKSKKGDKPGAAGAPDKTSAGGSSSPSLAQLSLLGDMLSKNLDTPGPYDELRQSSNFADDKPHFAVLELAGTVSELASFSWFGGMSGIPLRKLIDRLNQLGARKHLTGILLRVGNLGLDTAKAEELRAAMIAFKTAGGRTRTLACHVGGASNLIYYVLTACDSIGLAPTGGIVISGVAASPMHIKGLLDKAGLKADFLHVGAFKGAAEPLTRDRPSPQMNKTIDAILDRSFATQIAGIAEGRKLSTDRVRALIDTAMFQGDEAKTAKLVDQVAVYERYRDTVVGKAGWKVAKLKRRKKPGISDIMAFVGVMPRSRPTGSHVAVVYAVGGVVDGKGEGILGARKEIASRTLAAALRALARDDAVKAVVLRVDSGGGSALASEIIWHAVDELKKKKPVIVSMGSVAASGGYYIGAGATKIYALPNTLTGSIGVVGGKIAIAGGLEKLGVKAFPRGRGKRALMWSSLDPWSADERSAVQAMMEAVYKTFVTRVAAGRSKSYDQIHEIAQGRVWTGTDAKARGLVDELGGLDAALAEARTLGKVSAEVKLEIYPPEPTLLDFVGSFGGSVSMPFGLRGAVVEIAAQLGPAEARIVDTLLRQVLALRTSPVQTAFVFPVLFR